MIDLIDAQADCNLIPRSNAPINCQEQLPINRQGCGKSTPNQLARNCRPIAKDELPEGGEALEIALWEKVQRAYAASRSYRAGDDPDFAKALAEYERVACGCDPGTPGGRR